MPTLWQVSISTLLSQTSPNRLNTGAADRATGIIIYTHTLTHTLCDILTWCAYTQILTLQAWTVSLQLLTETGLVIFKAVNTLLCCEWCEKFWVVFLSMAEHCWTCTEQKSYSDRQHELPIPSCFIDILKATLQDRSQRKLSTGHISVVVLPVTAAPDFVILRKVTGNCVIMCKNW